MRQRKNDTLFQQSRRKFRNRRNIIRNGTVTPSMSQVKNFLGGTFLDGLFF